MKITFLGTGNAFAPRREWGCILVNDTILLDAGPSLLVNLKRKQVNPTGIRHLFITHFHGDHIFGLPFLLLEYAFLSPCSLPLTIIGPRGIAQYIEALMRLAYPNLAQNAGARPLRFVEAQDNITDTADGVTFTPVAVAHGSEEFQAFGYRLALPEGIIAYSGDTSLCEALNTLTQDARVSILEATSEDASSIHLGREALRTILAATPTDCLTFLNHLDTPGADPWGTFDVIVPEDLQSFELAFANGERPRARLL